METGGILGLKGACREAAGVWGEPWPGLRLPVGPSANSVPPRRHKEQEVRARAVLRAHITRVLTQQYLHLWGQ